MADDKKPVDKDAPYKASMGSGPLTDLPPQEVPAFPAAPTTAVGKDGLWYWVPDPELGWVEAMRLDGGKYSAKGDHLVDVPAGLDLGPNISSLSLQPQEDLTKMDDLVAGGVLNSIKSRFVTGEPYTSCGSFHLYVHDFKDKAYPYDGKAFAEFSTVPYKPEPHRPHVYNMAIRAYERSIEGGRSQRYPKGEARPEALVFMGSATSGKTEQALRATQFLCQIAKTDVAEQFLAAQALINSFTTVNTGATGTARRCTLCSRLYLDKLGLVSGAAVTYYGLDRLRVTAPPKGESNYSVFYQMIDGGPIPMKKKYAVKSPSDFNILKSGSSRGDGSQGWRSIYSALKVLDMLEFKDSLFLILAAVLHLGNIKFKDTGEAMPSSSLTAVCDILGITEESDLLAALSKGASTAEAGKQNADGMAQHLYCRLFDWMVTEINLKFTPSADAQCSSILIADISGSTDPSGVGGYAELVSEYFYEKVQSVYQETTFKDEKAILESQTITIEEEFKIPVAFATNDEILPLYEGDSGLLKAIETASSDDALKAKLKPNDKTLKAADLALQIEQHFEGSGVFAQFDATGMALNTSVKPTKDVMALLMTKCDHIAVIPPGATDKGGSADALQAQAQEVFDEIRHALPVYMFCSMANKTGAPGEFDGSYVSAQFAPPQLLTLAELWQRGFPYKYSHRRFMCKYYWMGQPGIFQDADWHALSEPPYDNGDTRTSDLCFELLKTLREDRMLRFLKMGKHMVLWKRQGTSRWLDRKRMKYIVEQAKILQRSLRVFFYKSKVSMQISLIKEMARAGLAGRLQELRARVAEAEAVGFTVTRENWPLKGHFIHAVMRARERVEHLELQEKVKDKLDTLLNKEDEDPNDGAYENFEAYKQLIEECEKLKMENRSTRRARENYHTAAMRKQSEKLMDEGLEEYDKNKIIAATGLSQKKRLVDKYQDYFEKRLPEISKVLDKIKAEAPLFKELETMISKTAIRGAPGNLNTRNVDLKSLSDAVVKLKCTPEGVHSQAGKVLLRSAHLVQELRKYVLQGDDDMIEELLERYKRRDTIPMIAAEFELVKEDFENRKMLRVLNQVITTGKISGEFGHIDVDAIKTEPVEAALTIAHSIPEQERLREFSDLLFAAEAIVRVRKGLKSALIAADSLETFMEVEEAEMRRQKEEELRAAEKDSDNRDFDMSMLGDILDAEGVAKMKAEIIRGKQEEKEKAKKDKERLRMVHEREKEHLMLEVKHAWERLKFTLLEANAALLHPLTMDEVKLAQVIWDEHDIRDQLLKGLRAGMGEGEIGAMDTECIDLFVLGATLKRAEKQIAISGSAEDTGVDAPSMLSAETEMLKRNAHVIHELRTALKAKNWGQVCHVISRYHLSVSKDSRNVLVLPQSEAEIERAFHEWQYHRTVQNLSEALQRGGPTGVPGNMDYSTVDVRQLDDAIKRAEPAAVPAQMAQELLRQAKYVRQIRDAVLKGDDKKTRELCSNAAMLNMSNQEVQDVLEDSNHKLIIDELEQALLHSGVGGTPDRLEVDEKGIRQLAAALNYVKTISCHTKVSQDLIKLAQFVLELRQTVQIEEPAEPFAMTGKWEALYDMMKDPMAAMVPSVANDDVAVVGVSVTNKLLQSKLSLALLQGKAVLDDKGDLDTNTISVKALEMAMRKAEAFRPLTESTQELLTAARDIRNLRALLQAQAWTSVQRVLLKLDSESVAPICRPEVHDAHSALEYQIVSTEVREALQSGQPTGAVGLMNTDTIVLKRLDRAIAHAMDVEFKSDKLQKLLVSAVLVRRLRAALKQHKWKAVAQLIKFTERADIEIVDDIQEEVERAREELEAKAVMAELDKAMSDGNEQSMRSAVDRAEQLAVDEQHPMVQQLDRAKEQLEKIDAVEQDMPLAMQAAYDVPGLLDQVLDDAEEVGLTQSPDVQQAMLIREEIKAVRAMAQQALKTLERAEMSRAVAEIRAKEIDIPELAQLQALLNLTEEELLQRQLIAAITVNNAPRVGEITRRMKDIYFQRHGYKDFALSNFPGLKTPLQFSKREMFRDRSESSHHSWDDSRAALEQRRRGMLLFQADPIHTSLTHLPHSVPKTAAIHAFDVFTRFISDAAGGGVEKDLAHVLRIGVQQPALRDEMYIQVIKQCTRNPSTASTIRCWNLMDMLLSCFPPTEDFENFLESFIRQRYNTESRLRKLHLILYIGRQAGTTPREEDILNMIYNTTMGSS